MIDSANGLVSDAGGQNGVADPGAKSDEIRQNVERLLGARVGAGNAVVEVNVELVRDRETISERTVDPQNRVAISSENETLTENSTQPTEDVTVSSNLPDGAAGAKGQGKSESNSSRERINFEVSEKHREILKEPGAIRRMTIAVLVDDVQVTAADGTQTWEKRSDQEMADLRELVASAAGLDEARGDVLTVKSMRFEVAAEQGTMVEAGLLPFADKIDTMALIQMGILALLAVILSLFVIRPVLMQSRAADRALPPPSRAQLPPMAPADIVALDGEIDEGDLPSLSVINPGPAYDDGAEIDPVARLKRLIDSRQEESVEILRGWLENKEEVQP